MVKRTKKQRGGGKKKPLLSAYHVTYRLDCDPEEAEEFRKSFIAAYPSLKTYLANVEERAKATLKKHGLPTTWPEILPYTGNYELESINASYAADVLFSIHEVREFIKKGDAHGAAYEAIRLGQYIACNDMEIMAGGRESGRTSEARKKKTEKGKAQEQQARMQAIAKKLYNWKPGMVLTKPERKEINKKLLSEYQANDRPTSGDMWKYAKKIGLM